MALFGEGIDGARAAELGLAWQALDDNEVEGAAAAMAAPRRQGPRAGPPHRALDARGVGPARAAVAGGARAGARVADVVDAAQGTWRTTAEPELSESPPLSRPELALRAVPSGWRWRPWPWRSARPAPRRRPTRCATGGRSLGWSAVVLWPLLFTVVNFVVPWPLLAGRQGLLFGTAGGTAAGPRSASCWRPSSSSVRALPWPASAFARRIHAARAADRPRPRRERAAGRVLQPDRARDPVGPGELRGRPRARAGARPAAGDGGRRNAQGVRLRGAGREPRRPVEPEARVAIVRVVALGARRPRGRAAQLRRSRSPC